MVKRCTELRKISYYPKVFSKFLVPAAQRALQVIDNELVIYASLATLNEILNKTATLKVLKERKRCSDQRQGFVYLCSKASECVSYNIDREVLLREIDTDLFLNTKEIKGVIGNSGFTSGKVKLVLSNDVLPNDFNKGDILVASSTNPLLVPIMKRAAAIITDEGGLLSHAVVIARELHKPCIIDTKIATSVLRDGDRVEVDATKGIVRKIS